VDGETIIREEKGFKINNIESTKKKKTSFISITKFFWVLVLPRNKEGILKTKIRPCERRTGSKPRRRRGEHEHGREHVCDNANSCRGS